MDAMLVIALVAQGLVPLGLVAWAGSRRHGSRVAALLSTLLAAAWIALIALAGIWLAIPWYLPLLYGALLAIAAVRALNATRARPVLPASPRGRVGAIVLAAALVAVAGLAVHALAGRKAPGEALDLAPPLRGGPYLVANGGANSLLSAHLMTLADEPRYRPWRGQSYGVDLVRLGAGGVAGRGIASADPAAYAIFGDTVYAPCAGTIVAATDGLPDLPVPEMDRAHMAGNHVILQCGATWVLLAHLREGSVRAALGQRVPVGQVVGQVGNTGNSSQPHLHLHAQRPGTASAPLGGEPVWITIGGRYLVRGQRVRW